MLTLTLTDLRIRLFLCSICNVEYDEKSLKVCVDEVKDVADELTEQRQPKEAVEEPDSQVISVLFGGRQVTEADSREGHVDEVDVVSP